jgi:hypothetical protein
MTDTKRWTRRGSTLQRLAGARLMDVDPARIEALDLRLLEAMKRGKLKLARQLATRRLALCLRLDDAAGCKVIQNVADAIEGAIARGLTEAEAAAPKQP